MAVAMVVIYFTYGAATPYMSPVLAGAAAGAAGAAVSQGVLIATGNQKSFNWNGGQ
jgi:uncharacterized membrane protein (DUF485 family)